ncbi:hypothetical protein, partial [Frankia sp. QA3]|uniref:hypothetical protein n=1 Tax=Frankia sp. QA3 TaxID=710111 RepID=UPI000568F1C7
MGGQLVGDLELLGQLVEAQPQREQVASHLGQIQVGPAVHPLHHRAHPLAALVIGQSDHGH